MRNIRLDICYDGTRYQGWQRLSASDNTIQGKIETVLSRVLDEPVEITGSGRTDAGVHARGQVANFHCRSDLSCDELQTELNRYLPDDIGIYSCKNTSPRFHARLNAKEKIYRYRIWNSDIPCVFERRFTAQFPDITNITAMEQGAGLLIGTHDFSSFCGNSRFKKSTVRCISDVQLIRTDKELQLLFRGNGFLHHMVRILTGTLIEVGRNQRDPDTIPLLFGAQRKDAGFLAPAKGLCLEEVIY